MGNGVIIAGYYGANNTGDEAILAGIIQGLKHHGITDITVLSRNPDQTKELHGVNSLYIGQRFTGLWRIYQTLRNSRLFILGGGGLLQDYSTRVVPYWLSRVVLAILARRPVMYYAHGVGPLRTAQAKRLVKLISNRVKQITVRDQASLELLHTIGVTKPPIEVTADPALAISITSSGQQLLEQSGVTLDKASIKLGIALRSWQDDKEYLPILIKALNSLALDRQVSYYFFPLQAGSDEQISNQVLNSLTANNSFLVAGEHTPEQIAAMLKEMDGVIAMRLHAVILSAISKTPAYGLVYDPKVYNFLERLSLAEYSYQVTEISSNEQEFITSLHTWLSNWDNIREVMSESVDELVSLADRNAEIAKILVEEGIYNG